MFRLLSVLEGTQRVPPTSCTIKISRTRLGRRHRNVVGGDRHRRDLVRVAKPVPLFVFPLRVPHQHFSRRVHDFIAVAIQGPLPQPRSDNIEIR
jgi:hypothetical protein